ncbi:MAG: TAXI family TRAP transporter solute-binding subunit [Chloroflexota bacterium]
MKNRQLIIFSLIGLSILAALTILFVRSLPPQTFTILTGSEQGEYYRVAKKYAEIADQKGLTLEIRPTAGSLESLQLLTKGEASIGFVQGGIATSADGSNLSTLASVFREPVWIFYRKGLEAEGQSFSKLTQLHGMRIAIGADGSGTQPLAQELLSANGISEQNATLLPLSSSQAAEGLLDGSVDFMFVVVGPRSELIQKLIRSPQVALMSLERADAYRNHVPYLASTTLPVGAIDLQANIPAEDKKMVTTVANLVIRNDLHPVLLRLMVLASIETHRSGGIFEARNEFPNLDYPDLPIRQESLAYLTKLRDGDSFLDNYLPFWVAAIVDQYLLLFLPALLVVLPILGRSPLLYRVVIRSRITRWYKDIRRIDQEAKGMEQAELVDNIAYLDQLEAQLNEQLKVGDAFMPDVYNLKMHLDMVQQKLKLRSTEQNK